VRGKWTQLAFLCAIFAVYTIDRTLLGALALPIQRSTGVTDVQFGFLSAAIFWTYAAVVPFAGYAGDRFDRARLIGIASMVWSTMALLAGFASGFWSLLILVSVAVTAPQTVYSPSAVALIASRHRETRTVAMSIHQMSFYTGSLLSGAAVAGILACFGTWRAAYFIFGMVGIALGAAFLFCHCRGEAGVVSSAGQEVADKKKPGFKVVARAFFCCPSAVIAALGHVAFTFVAFGYTSWAPKFVALKFNLDAGKAAAGVMLWHFVAAMGAVLATGFITDRFVGRWPRFRLALQSASLVVAVPVMWVFGTTHSLAAAFGSAAMLGVLKGSFEANSFNSIFDVVPAECRASAVGFVNVLAGVIGAFAPIALGFLSQRGGIDGLGLGFAALGSVLALAFILMCVSIFRTFERDRIRSDK